MKKSLICIALLAAALARAEVTFQNPIQPGTYPDPSICRVGDDYYMVHSSFGYFPGVPIFHSKNLVNWEQIGHVLDRPSQVPLDKADVTMGIFAPTIRYNNGVYYMITTNVTAKGNFYVTATDPRGPWSEPVWVDVPGIDPSLLFDDDGKVWVTSTLNWGKDIHEGIYLAQLDVATGKLLTPLRNIWTGTGGQYPEGPHLYKKDGWYYLMIAEGGTQSGHKITIARSKQIEGPYEANPANPILTHATNAKRDSEFQGVGHGDMVQAADGSWFMVALAFRVHEDHQILGRETVLAPVQWSKNAWPVVNGDGGITAQMSVASLPGGPVTPQSYVQHDGFDGKRLALVWNHLHAPVAENYSLTQRPGYLRMLPGDGLLRRPDQLSFIGRRQQHFNFEASTQLEFEPRAGQQAGLTVYKDGKHHYALSVQRDGDKRVVVLSYQLGKIHHEEARAPLATGPVRLRVSGDKDAYSFSYAQGKDGWRQLGQADTRYLSSVTAGGFTGSYIGLYSQGKAATAAPADFDWFVYDPVEQPAQH
ncbi:family 43 glycosylhydrolase [Duganella sp. FT80W]|uniref:Family 43 glycosylhydrolase n=1 Tax=Duganella guangzhouensis TaxID=2666084 RepID=A0A6I2L595_9BURK|nr:glycoside hydrolase family 43 protein [Duganella guangzhouensis]MRW92064.1 family 43 glycosylhydrolase [Duganella guangzhouensis]